MKRKQIIIYAIILVVLIILVFAAIRMSSKRTKDYGELYRAPRVLIITTGKDGTGTLPEGVILTMESFAAKGALTRIDTRDALLDSEYLSEFDILLLLTAAGYHDADRRYSLTFMEDIELEIIRRWVENGGVLIAGDNLGRNLRNGTDRISIYGRLEPENWPLSQCFGVMMSERNMEGFKLIGDIADTLKGDLLPELSPGTWILVPDSVINDDIEVLAYWYNDTLQFPALVMNHYGKGISFLLPSSYLLHPSNEGGHWSPVQIDAFCNKILDEYYGRFPVTIGFHPWPDARPAAFAVSLNSDGSIDDYERIFHLLKQKNVSPSLFVNGTMDESIRNFLSSASFQLQSNGWRKTNMRDLTFSETVFQIEMNEQEWDRQFMGFRFPYTLNSVWGMDYLHRKGYIYESSIGADHTHTFLGSIFPYRLPVFQGENYQVLDLLEISPLAKDDYFYFRSIQESSVIDPNELRDKAMLFDKYLKDFWKSNALRKGGLMVYLGHPLFSGHNETTSQPLANLIDTVRRDHAWITTMEEIAQRWKIIENVQYIISANKRDKRQFSIEVRMPNGSVLESASFRISQKPLQVDATAGKVSIKQHGDVWLVSFRAFDRQKISIRI